jgi:5-methylcytosine-specific restriction endonuclease McrA
MIDERGAHCACCGETLRSALTFDHIIPKALGGTSEPYNIQLLCLTCNGLKGSGRTDCPHTDEARRLLLEHVAA